MRTVIGIDPGINGAIAILEETGRLAVFDIGGSLVDAIDILRKITAYREQKSVIIEKVSAMPKQGVASSFNFGCTYGHLRGACIALGFSILAEPTSPVWKKAVGIVCSPPKRPRRGANEEEKQSYRRAVSQYRRDMKRMSRDRARILYPHSAEFLGREKDSDRAEALLLAHYGLLLQRRSTPHDSD